MTAANFQNVFDEHEHRQFRRVFVRVTFTAMHMSANVSFIASIQLIRWVCLLLLSVAWKLAPLTFNG